MESVQGLSSRVYVTEFGGTLDRNVNYLPDGESSDLDSVNCLRGMHEALMQLKSQGHGIKGAYHWHGWHNSDTFDFWECANAKGAAMVAKILADMADLPAAPSAPRQPPSHASCPVACAAPTCQAGNYLNGGEQLIGGRCVHTCSHSYDGERFCGVGQHYTADQAVSCGSCVCPERCDGLPCSLDLTQIV